MIPDTSTTAGKAAVMQAKADNPKLVVQVRQRQVVDPNWYDLTGTPKWNWEWNDYRMKPAEPLRCWINVWHAPHVDKPMTGKVHTSREEAERTGIGPGLAVEFVQITPEVEAALKAAGIL